MIQSSKLRELYILLDEAEALVAQHSGGYSYQFFSAKEFHAALVESIQKLKEGDNEQIRLLWLWFAPTCDWDDFTGGEGLELANQIFSLLSELEKELKPEQ